MAAAIAVVTRLLPLKINAHVCVSTGPWPTNLKHHSMQYHDVLGKEKEDKSKKAAKPTLRKFSSQATIERSLRGKCVTPYSSNSDRYRLITKKLAIFVGSTNVPISIVENSELRLLMKVLDPRYEVPGRTLMGRCLDTLMVELKASIQQYLSAAQRISLCADIWSKKGLTSSYLGITAHFFSRKDHCRHCVTLAVTRFPHPHTGQHVREVVEEVLGEWEIPVSKVTAILTVIC